jgi:hypothetical protein
MSIELVTGAAAGSWTITVPAECTLVELANIMGGIGCRTAAHFLRSGSVQLRPLDPYTPCPTAIQLRDIMEHGVPRLPVIVCRPSYVR